MARKNGKSGDKKMLIGTIPPQTRKALLVIFFVVMGAFLTLAAFGAAGAAGSDAYTLFAYLLGVGYFLVPILFFILAGSTLKEESGGFNLLKSGASIVFILAGLAFIQLVSGQGGLVGATLADPAVKLFDVYAALVILGGVSLMSLLILLEGGISFSPLNRAVQFVRSLFSKTSVEPVLSGLPLSEVEENMGEEEYAQDPAEEAAPAAAALVREKEAKRSADALKTLLGEYTPPPLSLLERDRGRPGVGDIKGNANIIKRTLQTFGIVVELDEISIGPSVTRYAIKPAEGVKLQKIIGLQTNLELALAAHPVRIEAPIPGKSLVGIEVPNSSRTTVGLGTLLEAPEFAQSSKPLLVALGRDIAGNSLFANLAQMPHILIAGATGAGKSVAIHGLINSLIYRASPAQLRFIMIDPKRVELSLYRSLPHLLTPVITDAKKAISALRWASKEMQRRYTILEETRVRDIESYHQNILTPQLETLRKKGSPEEGEVVPEAMPYIVIILDELASIMQLYPRELEATVASLAQMSRAVGIHLILSTQRPEVNIITGLIKANVPARAALQVNSQFDSRTILDQGGAENLLGRGDMLFLSAEMNKPVRLQNAFISEKEVKEVVDFIAKNNEIQLPIDLGGSSGSESSSSGGGDAGFGDEEEIDDEMLETAKKVVLESGKASTSYLQRRLSLGYARAARIIDALEAKGVIGPGHGAKPREVYGRSDPASSEPPQAE